MFSVAACQNSNALSHFWQASKSNTKTRPISKTEVHVV